MSSGSRTNHGDGDAADVLGIGAGLSGLVATRVGGPACSIVPLWPSHRGSGILWRRIVDDHPD